MQRWIQDSSLGRRQHFMGCQPTILPRLPIKIETDKNLSVGVNSVSANGWSLSGYVNSSTQSSFSRHERIVHLSQNN